MSTEPTTKPEQAEEAEQQVAPEQNLTEVLKQYDGAPSQEQIEKWKAQYSEVFVSGFSETELYIWRPILRPEWVKLQTLAQDPENKVDQFKFEELICDTCVLWKSTPATWENAKAGAASTIHEQILQNSNFMSPQAASLFVARL